MRFIRKGGRVIPIQDGKGSVQPHRTMARVAAGAMGAGAIGVVGGVVGKEVGKITHASSIDFGKRALFSAKQSIQSKSLGRNFEAIAHKNNARMYAKASLQQGKISTAASKIGKHAFRAGAIGYLAGAAGLVGLGISARRRQQK